MALYVYLKAVPIEKRTFRFLPIVLIFVGLFLVTNAVWPILDYQLSSIQFRRRVISPIASPPAGGVVAASSEINVDYTKLSNWLPVTNQTGLEATKITYYNLSIPKLKINKAIVHIGGDDLSQSLIHYPGTALPGQYGNVVIFGHSVLPQFFNPKNYKTIFSTLPTLEKGDEILVNFDGINYRYLITKMVEVMPEDVSILGQQYDAEHLTLITCVPPGTYLRRLVVKARLAQSS